jgi:DNA-binding NtrC family response regulator
LQTKIRAAALEWRDMGEPDRTLTLRPSRHGRGNVRQPYLLLALDSAHPLAGSARYPLGRAIAATLGRAPGRRFAAEDTAAGRQIAIGFPDAWMSKEHVRLERVGGRWHVVDLGSKNGTLVNGKRIERVPLAPGDVLEIGRIFFRYGEGPVDDEPVDSAHLAAAMPDLPTWNPALAHAFGRLQPIARSAVPVVIQGESGTGKELVARSIHQVSGRTGPMLAVNCAAIAGNLVESELFGHRRGAFTGADEDRPGLFRSADRGTVVLDEIGDLPKPAQAALLRVLQEHEVVPVGGARPMRIDVRVVAASQEPIEALVERGRFRADLYARLSGVTVELPPLRDRMDDLGLLVASLIRRLFADRAERVVLSIAAARAMFAHRWPLNVRELEQALRSAIVLAGERAVEVEDLPEQVRRATWAREPTPSEQKDPAQANADRREHLVALLEQNAGNVSAVARALGKTRAQVHRWIRRYALDVHGFRR